MTYNNLHVSRDRDDAILLMLRLRTLGHSTRAIGERLGISPQNVRVTTNAIKAADLYESGEPREQVEAAYWGQA